MYDALQMPRIMRGQPNGNPSTLSRSRRGDWSKLFSDLKYNI
jgi:hypothetical protein